MNKSDSQRITSVLEDIGYKPAQSENKADLIVVNMCSVRQSAVDRVYGKIKNFTKLKIKNKNLKVILTGCILKEDRKKFTKSFNLIVDIKKLRLRPIFLKNSPVQKGNISPCDYLAIQPKYQKNFTAFIPISNGCNNFCTYCVVPFTRGQLTCRSHYKILKEVKNVVKKGFREIWLLGQNVNDYYSPSNAKINFAKLLKMINDVPGKFKILFISPHPTNFSPDLIETLAKCDKFGKYLNLPLQSGDNKVLKRMNRNYTVKEYKNLVKKIREKISQIKLSTDVIVGFPGETEKQFQNTAKLLKEIKFDNAYIAKYSPRQGTAAFKLKDDILLSEKKIREKILRKIIQQHG